MPFIGVYSAVLSLAVHGFFVFAFAPPSSWTLPVLFYCALGFMSCFLLAFTPLYLVTVLPVDRRLKTAAWIAIPFALISCAGLDAIAYKLFKTHLDYFVVSNAVYALWTGEVDPGRITASRLAQLSALVVLLIAALAAATVWTERWRRDARHNRVVNGLLLVSWAVFFLQGEAVSAMRKAGFRAWGIFPFERTSLTESWELFETDNAFSADTEFARFANIQEARAALPAKITAKRRPNIVLIHAESLRGDAFTPALMPLLSARAARCEKQGRCRVLRGHYTTGNNTSMGIFGILSGLNGFYYFPHKRADAAPVPLTVFDLLGYRSSFYASTDMNYDGMRRLFFDKHFESFYQPLKGKHSHNSHMEERDLQMLKVYRDDLRRTDFKAAPRFDYIITYLTHYNYYFTDKCAKHSPVLELPFKFDNGAISRMDEHYVLLRNRYLNGACETDLQTDSVIEELRKLGQWDNTILVVFGDHGEEFGEKGRVGHGNGHNDEQVRTAFIAFFPTAVPDIRYRTTSHSDLMPTLFKYLGVSVDGAVFMNGKNLFDFDPERDFSVVSDGSYDEQMRYRHSVVAPDMKVVFQNFGRLNADRTVVYAPGDEELLDFDRARATQLLRKALDSKLDFAGAKPR